MQPMRRRRVGISVAGFALIVLATTFMLRAEKQVDGLDWIRQYSPQERVFASGQRYPLAGSVRLSGAMKTSSTNANWQTHEFSFPTVPKEVIQKLGNGRISGTGNSMGKLPDGGWFMLKPSAGHVVITVENKSSWLEKKWLAVTRFFGAKEKSRSVLR